MRILRAVTESVSASHAELAKAFACVWRRTMVPPMRLAAACAWMALLGCSTNATHYAASGDCVSDSAATCGTLGGGGGAEGSQAEAGAESDSGSTASGEAGSCGSAATSLPTQNTVCQGCIATYCCQTAQYCSASNCNALLQCAFAACPTGTTTPLADCAQACENTYTPYPSAISDYTDYGNCITFYCVPQCPALPTLP